MSRLSNFLHDVADRIGGQPTLLLDGLSTDPLPGIPVTAIQSPEDVERLRKDGLATSGDRPGEIRIPSLGDKVFRITQHRDWTRRLYAGESFILEQDTECALTGVRVDLPAPIDYKREAPRDELGTVLIYIGERLACELSLLALLDTAWDSRSLRDTIVCMGTAGLDPGEEAQPFGVMDGRLYLAQGIHPLTIVQLITGPDSAPNKPLARQPTGPLRFEIEAPDGKRFTDVALTFFGLLKEPVRR